MITVSENLYVLLISFCHFVGSSSTPAEDRLLKYLLDGEHQSHNLLTTPLEDWSQPMEVNVGIHFIKLIDLV